MNKKIIILLLILVILVIAVLSSFLYYQSLNKSVKPIVTNQNLNSPATIINANHNINTDIGLPPVSTPPMQGTPIINTNSSQPDFQPVSISISNFSFHPQQITTKIGTTVTWINDDPAPHTITGNGFASQTLITGDSYSFTFTQAGTYDYHCAIHPTMTGQIIVQ